MTRWVTLALVVAGLVIASKLVVENLLGIRLEPTVTAWLAHAGLPTAVLIVALLAADVALPIPSSLVMVLSGAAFGPIWGALLALVGSVGGEWLGFELVRRYGRRASSRLVGDEELRQLESFFATYGVAAVVLTRPLPVVMETMSVVAGLSRMRRLTFLGASLAGTIPIVLLYAYAGAKAREVGNALPAAVILIAMTALGWLVYRRQRASSLRPPTPRPPSFEASRD